MAADPSLTNARDRPAAFATFAFDPIEVTVEPTESGSNREAVFQPWACSVGAIYVAWTIGAETGRLGIYDSTRNRVWLGPTGYPHGDGRYRYFVDLHKADESVAKQVWRGYTSHQSPSAQAKDHSLEPWQDSSGYINPRHPAPSDAAAVGDLHSFEFHWWGPTSPGLFQPWRPLSSGAVYLAFFFGDDFGEYAVWDEGPLVWFGRAGPLGVCYSVYPADDETFDALTADVDSLYESVPDAGFHVV